MFPLHETAGIGLIILLLGTIIAGYVLWRGVFTWKGWALTSGVALLWPVPLALAIGIHHYSIQLAMFLSGLTFAALIGGVIWGVIARRITIKPLAFAGLALPLLAGGTYLLDWQYVPKDAPCAQFANVEIGDIALAVPRFMGMRSEVADGAPAQDWTGGYGSWSGAKPDVRNFCRATTNGADALRISHIWMSLSFFRNTQVSSCETELERPYCQAAARTELTVTQFYARPDGKAAPSLSHFNTRLIDEALARGERNGHDCNGTSSGPNRTFCTVWMDLTPEVFAVSSAWVDNGTDGATFERDARIVLEAMVEAYQAN